MLFSHFHGFHTPKNSHCLTQPNSNDTHSMCSSAYELYNIWFRRSMTTFIPLIESNITAICPIWTMCMCVTRTMSQVRSSVLSLQSVNKSLSSSWILFIHRLTRFLWLIPIVVGQYNGRQQFHTTSITTVPLDPPSPRTSPMIISICLRTSCVCKGKRGCGRTNIQVYI